MAGQSVLAEQYPIERLQYRVVSYSLRVPVAVSGGNGGLGAALAAVTLGVAGGRANRYDGTNPPGRNTFSGQKLLISSAGHRLWGQQWHWVPL